MRKRPPNNIVTRAVVVSCGLGALLLAAGVAPARAQQKADVPASEANTPPAASAGKAADLPKITVGGTASATATQAPEEQSSQIVQVESLLFTAEEMTALRAALSAHAKLMQAGANNGDDFLRQLTEHPHDNANAKIVPKFYTYPQFFLESLVYHSPQDWVIQINHKKISQAGPVSGMPYQISIIGVDKDSVIVEWKPDDWEKVRASWDRVADHDTDSAVSVDVIRGLVIFTLHPDQTFSSYVMRVLQGKVKQMVVSTAAADASADAAAAPPAKTPRKPADPAPAAKSPAPPAAKPPAPASTNEGVSGLLNEYKAIEQELKQ